MDENVKPSTLWSQAEDLFHAALQEPAASRGRWLDSQTQVDPAVRAEVRSLLAAQDRHERLSVEEPARAPAEEAVATAPTLPGRLGPYRIERLIGTGGMGAVYFARRDDGQFRQEVAIKVMGLHLAGSLFLDTLRHERQVLAGLNHPNITRLLDGGVAESGEPYLVMEYVDGQTLDQYCDSRRLTVGARLELFQQVCRAVEYAHRSLVVHRDLKPANILVDSEGAVKLLDFGTAKLLSEQAAVATQAGLMTPRYASPEQLRGEQVTTACDVFSLGVILYELLTGAWPFGNPKSAVGELDRLLHGRPPVWPAEAITEDAAGRRSVSRDRLKRELSGDLSTILLRMLESDPAQRYDSVRQVHEDLDRYRKGLPILARPHTPWYAARKFAARHWLAVSASGLAVLVLAGLTLFSMRQSAQAREQAARAQRITEFVKKIFISASSVWESPLRGQSRAIQFSDVLNNAAERVGQELGNDPLAEADLRGTLGMTYGMLGEPVKGEAQILLGLKRLHEVPGGAKRVAATLLADLCDVRSFQGHYAEALAACREALALARVAGSDMAIGSLMHDTAYMAVKSGEPLEEAEKLYREALFNGPTEESLAKLYPPIVQTRIGQLRLAQGDFAEGGRVLAGAERLLRAAPGPPIELVPVLNAQAFGARIGGRYAEAEHLLQENLDLLDQRPTPYMGRDQIELQLSAVEALLGRPGALARLRRVEPTVRAAAFSPVDRVQLDLVSGTVEAHSHLPAEAERHLRSALATSVQEVPRQPAERVEIYVRLAQFLEASARKAEAADVAREGLRTAESAYGSFAAQHPLVEELRRVGR